MVHCITLKCNTIIRFTADAVKNRGLRIEAGEIKNKKDTQGAHYVISTEQGRVYLNADRNDCKSTKST